MKIREQVFILPTSMPGNFLHLLCQGAFFVYTRICAASHAGQAGYRFSILRIMTFEIVPRFSRLQLPHICSTFPCNQAAGQILADQTSVFSQA